MPRLLLGDTRFNLNLAEAAQKRWNSRTLLCDMTVGFKFNLIDDKDTPSIADFKTELEKGNDATKIDTMKRILNTMLNGDSLRMVT